MFAIRARRKVASERDFLDAVEKVVRQGTKFSSTYVACAMDELESDVDAVADRCTKYTTSRRISILVVVPIAIYSFTINLHFSNTCSHEKAVCKI